MDDLVHVIARLIMVMTYNKFITNTERDFILGTLSEADYIEKLKKGGN